MNVRVSIVFLDERLPRRCTRADETRDQARTNNEDGVTPADSVITERVFKSGISC